MTSLEELALTYSDRVALSRTSYLGLKAGDLVNFAYGEDPSRLGLVVKSKRSGIDGRFLSTRNNLLLNIFLLDSITESMFELIVNNLYRNRIRCTYKNTPRILGAFIGSDNFRTFNITKIENLLNIQLRKQ